MDENFLLNTPLARWLYQEGAENLPVIDYHNHLSVKELAAGRRFENLARLWVISDPYKHRAMRICGVAEKYITGDAADVEKFKAWMETLPKLIGNALYDWSVLEMKRVFGIELDPQSMDWEAVWENANAKLLEEDYSAPKLLSRFKVEYAAPCASMVEDITDFFRFDHMAPSLRGDDIAAPTHAVIEKLASMTNRPIHTLSDYFEAMRLRMEEFHQSGCRFSDHALDNGFVYFSDDGRNEQRFKELAEGSTPGEEDRGRLTSEILRFLAGEYAGRKWTMQLHIGAQRHTSSRLRRMAGPAGGFAGIGNTCDVVSLTQMLDSFEQGENGLPDTILFTLNPADNAVMSVLSGSYSQDGVAAKVQQGPAWWWCDHLYGMREVFENISAFGVLSTFAGMTTDSRSILSFVRHEYFRRAFCGWLGEKVEKGEITAPPEALKRIVENVCYYNAKKRIAES